MSNPKTFQVIGYFPSWSGVVADVAFDQLTQINYAFVLPAPAGDGSLAPLENEAQLRELVRAAHSQQVKVLISVGGWNNGDDSAFRALAARAETRQAFARNLLALCQRLALDGADIDWEAPRPETDSAEHFLSLMQTLSTTLRAEGKLLTAAVVGAGALGEGVRAGVFETVDYLGLMAYDGGEGAAHSPYEYAERAFDYWLGRGLPAGKAVLGMPFYSRPGWKAYRELVEADAQAALVDLSPNGEHYNGIPTMQRKARLARARGAGIMIWELSQDSPGPHSLLRAINAVVNEKSTSPGANSRRG